MVQLSLSPIRHAARRLVRARAFALAAVMTLMLGIGGATAVFTIVDGVLLRPMPYVHAERLVDVSHALTLAGIPHVDQSDATYLLYRRDNRVFTDIGAYRATAVNLGGPPSSRDAGAGTAERVPAALATASVFAVLGVSPQWGRGLTAEDGRLGAAPVALIGQRLWERKFGGNPHILENPVVIDGEQRQVVGVMPASFRFPFSETAIWLPLPLDPAHTKSAAFDYRGIARLREGASSVTAAADLQRVLPSLPDVFPGRLTAVGIERTGMRAVVRPLRDVVVGDVARVLWIVLGAVGVLLLVACANVANLFLARAEGRQRELAVRRALGAGRAMLLAEFLSEALILSGLGGALGLAWAWAGIRVLQSSAAATSIPRLAELGIDGVVLAVTAGTVTLAALGISVVPMMRARRESLTTMLMASGRSATGGRGQHRARRGLVIAQVALALVLLAGAGLLTRSFARLRAVDPGFTADHALTFRVTLPGTDYRTSGDVARLVARTLDALGAEPGVRSVGVATKLPLDEESRQDSAVFVEDHPTPVGSIPGIHQIVFATRGYFQAMGVPLMAGRVFDALDPGADPARTPREVIVSDAFAKRYWPRSPAIGKRIRMNPSDAWYTIVGVVGSLRDVSLTQTPAEVVYCPLVTTSAAGSPWAPRDLAFVVRTAGNPANVAGRVRSAMRAQDPTLPLYRVMPLSVLLSEATTRTTFTLSILGIAALVATIIGAMGIYAVISYLVSLRTREIGVRLALGARPADVRGLLTRQALADAAIGIAAGLGAAALLTPALEKVLFGVSATDPATYGGAAALLLVTAVAASWLPARRAAALDPAVALRSE